jgi:sulfide dehydrogenase cytochrome subunit
MAGGAALLGVALLGVLAFSTAAAAQDLDPEGLADGCTSCHGINGRSQGYIPSIGGLDKGTILRELQAFRDQKAAATIMNRIARAYTDAELAALAEYFSSVKQP